MSVEKLGLLAAAIGLVASPARAWFGCELDELSALVRGDTLTVYHGAAAYNCCMDSTTYSVSQAADTIRIEETEVLTNPCFCVCCFDLSVEVRDLAPGDYTLLFAWFDYDTNQWEQWTEPITVSGPGGQPFVAATTNSGCIDPTGAPGAAGSASWGRVKSRYD